MIGERSSTDDARTSHAEFDLKRSLIGLFQGNVAAEMWQEPAVAHGTIHPRGKFHAR
jgi:hypothetical protein